MCGINGFTFNGPELIDRMNSETRHRGPDGTGVFLGDRISIGHNLLAITDKPERSNQPVIFDDAVLAYNGEIYNYKILRGELGGAFRTDSDTEVVSEGLRRHGVDFLAKLDGMFAIAWYDRKREKIFLARDPVGMKPMYYAIHGGNLIFSSELRGLFAHDIPRRLNHAMMPVFFALGYVPGKETLISGIFKVMPGQIIEFDLQKKSVTESWMPIDDREQIRTVELSNCREIIGAAVNEHTMGLRPFGLYLSGGLDSTIILHELSRRRPENIKTYTTRFAAGDPAFNEDADRAQKLCRDYRIEHHELLVSERDFIDATEPAIAAMEEPRYNHSVPAYWLLAKHASKDVVVVLNGSGGDELFMGYSRYEVSKKISGRRRWPWWKIGYFFKHVHDPLSQWAYVHAINNKNNALLLRYLESLHYPRVTQPLTDTENAVAEFDRLFWLADEEFLRTDKISMQFGMEGRFPLLARSVRTLANSIPSSQKGSSKALLRAAYQNNLPDYIVQKKKTGWNAPVTEWMRGKFGAFVREVLADKYVDLPRYTFADMKKILPLFYFKIWARHFKIST